MNLIDIYLKQQKKRYDDLIYKVPVIPKLAQGGVITGSVARLGELGININIEPPVINTTAIAEAIERRMRNQYRREYMGVWGR